MPNLKAVFEKHEHGHLTEEIEELEEGYDVMIDILDRNTYNLIDDINKTNNFIAYEDSINNTIIIEHV
ncbi:hypothetical protein R0H42_000454 [Listeria monocytogenes]|uniref:hypothetical protein n=1 Tax=Listeria TaxID=1637 RepID=UPI00086F10DC|nr:MULTISPECIES: hypothetical protein [Listeria]EAA0155270.1 hypothetical protein [Listeria monocytogenes]EAD3258861.1 hypothetical protein [Listeria monocytogenes]EAE7221462.1 hypothetical protein [Listeria monocytogenes]EAE9608082.1 hypothetical protein [Listeria monocytogenes]EAF0871774.1 hypothetical protein [Listeria monocytogenes]